jgi:hypothetical protein
MLSLLLVSTVAAPEWTLLAFPKGARGAGDAAPIESVLADAAHLDVHGSFRPPDAQAVEPPISGALFQQMLEETLRQRGMKLEMRPQSGRLLARGEPPALEVARALVADLDRQMDAFEIDLEVTLHTTGANAAETTWRRRVPAGAEVFFGSRATRPFLAGFDVQVAQDAGQSEPVIGEALCGTGLHLRATRLAGGTRVFLDGVLDSAKITSMEAFDPETNDLGVFEQPRLESVQVAFAGAAESGSALEVRLTDAGPARGATTLSVRATARPDAAPTTDGWVLVDLGFSSYAPRGLEPIDPGLGMLGSGSDLDASGALLTPPTVASILDADRSANDSRGGRTQLYWSRSLLVIPRADAARIDAARALVRIAEESGATTVRAEVACGSLRVSLPVAVQRAARLVVGTESVYVTDYGLEVAPQIWMPSPRVERAFDGIAAWIRLESDELTLDAWRSSTPEVVVASHEAAQMGRLQLPVRTRVAGAGRTAIGAPPAAVFDEGAVLSLAASAP